MRSRIVMMTIAAGVIGCSGSTTGLSNPLGTSGPSGIAITAGDSAGISAWRPSTDTAALTDTVEFVVASGTVDTFNVVWTVYPTGGTPPVNSGKLTANSPGYVVSFGTPGIYAYEDTFHPGDGGGIYVANDNYGQRVRWCGSAPCKP
jgi:hypothetical protein